MTQDEVFSDRNWIEKILYLPRIFIPGEGQRFEVVQIILAGGQVIKLYYRQQS